MMWIGLILMLLFGYMLQLMEAQEMYKAGKISYGETTALIRTVNRLKTRSIVTFSSLAVLAAAITLFIIDTKWWTPLWVLIGLIAGKIIVRITSNPLIGETPSDRWLNK